MNRFVFGRGWVYEAPAGDDTMAGGGAGEDTLDGAAGEDTIDGASGEDTVAGAGGEDTLAGAGGEAPKDMKSAIDAALGYGKAKTKEGEQAGEKKLAAAKPAEKKPAAAGTESETHHANGKPKKDDKGNELDAEGKVVKAAAAAKPKTAAELDLKPEEKKLLGAAAQARFGELITTLKSHEGTIAKQTETIKSLSTARDALLDTMEEVGMTQDHLANYMELHALLRSDSPKDWEVALQRVEAQRVALYKALGREPAGGDVDLLKDFPDLAKDVEDEVITRDKALELAHLRRDKAARDDAARRQQQDQQSKKQTTDQQKAVEEKALKDIDAWVAEMSKGDLDYSAKEHKLLAEINGGLMKEYPPHLWLPTLKRLYAGIEIQKAGTTTPSGQKPLRPSGAKPGAKAPNSMLEAIDQGLGYATAEKG